MVRRYRYPAYSPEPPEKVRAVRWVSRDLGWPRWEIWHRKRVRGYRKRKLSYLQDTRKPRDHCWWNGDKIKRWAVVNCTEIIVPAEFRRLHCTYRRKTQRRNRRR